MDNKTKNMLVRMMEICGKITQYCSKSINFGLFSHHPNKNKTNGDEILIKYYHLQAIIESLQRDNVLPIYRKEYVNHIKREAINNTKPPKRKF